MEIVTWFQSHWTEIVQIITGLVTVASIIVKLTPTLADDSFMLKVVKFLGRYVALNRTVNDDYIRSSAQ